MTEAPGRAGFSRNSLMGFRGRGMKISEAFAAIDPDAGGTKKITGFGACYRIWLFEMGDVMTDF